MSLARRCEDCVSTVREGVERLGNRTRRATLARLAPRTMPGTAVVREEWETLFVLDACRYDTFAAENHLEGTLSKRYSRGATSTEFLRENFGDRMHHDLVYVSANPYTSTLPDRIFHDLVPVYEQWDETLQTVTPTVMNEAVRNAHKRYPNKRIVAHYMQPHYPFIGERGRELDHRGYAPDGDYTAMDSYSIWTQLQFGIASVSREAVIEAYRENLQLVLRALEGVLPEIEGKVVLTADHGNMLGERLGLLPVPVYGHYDGLHTPELVEVPWFELPFESRRKIDAEPPVGRATPIEDAVIERRLRALGYRA